jgi:serine/threonine-protein phosphatase CPPED1
MAARKLKCEVLMILSKLLINNLNSAKGLLQHRPAKIIFLLMCIFMLAGFKAGFNLSGLPTKNWIAGNLIKVQEIPPDSFSFAVFGDNRDSHIIFPRLLQDINRDADIGFVMGLGDFVSHGRRSEYRYFFDQVKKNLDLPLLPVIGNHETHGEDRPLYEALFGMLYYSYQIGNSYFIMLDNADRGKIDPEQKLWLQKELQKAKNYTHRFIFMHYPLYYPSDENPRAYADKKSTEDLLFLFKKYKVDHIFAAHVHGYFDGQWQDIPFSVTGGAGAEMHATDADNFFYHYLKVTVNGDAIDVKVRPINLPDYAAPRNIDVVYLPKLYAFVHFYGIQSIIVFFTGWMLILFVRERRNYHH